KRLKSLLHIDRLPAKDERLARAWIFAHLIVALLVEDLSPDLRDSPP
ncbi:MAG TPA: IS4 family transposase, partial [Caulobacteraceae bacterium]|nr:IS4 family transposase [Caulobacteraceae bacterium]